MLQFFAFVANIVKPFLKFFLNDRLMLPFILNEFASLIKPAHTFVMKREAIKKVGSLGTATKYSGRN